MDGKAEATHGREKKEDSHTGWPGSAPGPDAVRAGSVPPSPFIASRLRVGGSVLQSLSQAPASSTVLAGFAPGLSLAVCGEPSCGSAPSPAPPHRLHFLACVGREDREIQYAQNCFSEKKGREIRLTGGSRMSGD